MTRNSIVVGLSTCTFNASRVLIDCAFKDVNDAKAYAAELNGDKAKEIPLPEIACPSAG